MKEKEIRNRSFVVFLSAEAPTPLPAARPDDVQRAFADRTTAAVVTFVGVGASFADGRRRRTIDVALMNVVAAHAAERRLRRGCGRRWEQQQGMRAAPVAPVAETCWLDRVAAACTG